MTELIHDTFKSAQQLFKYWQQTGNVVKVA